MDEDDYRREEYEAQLYEEMSQHAVAEFGGERLIGFYKNNPFIAQKPLRLLLEAKALLQASFPSAALIHAFITIEVLIKEVFARPLIGGSIHLDALSDVIVNMAFASARLDLTQHQRATAAGNILEEVKTLQTKRNGVIHKGESATKAEAELAIAVASEILEALFVALLKKLSFHVHEDYKLCKDYACEFSQPIRDAMKLGPSPVLRTSSMRTSS